MPEIITKYPDITLKVLRDAGAKCGEGAPQQILTKCPVERFCSLPTGEMCVYGLNEIPQMTQIKAHELTSNISPAPAQVSGPPSKFFSQEVILLIFLSFLVGITAGILFNKMKSVPKQ